MGLFDRFIKQTVERPKAAMPRPTPEKERKIVAGVRADESIQSFTNSNITFNGDLAGYDYGSILRDKQRNIINLYKLSDYYTDADPIIRGIIRHVYVPYSACSRWVLTGAKEKTCKIYEEKYEEMRLREKIDAIMMEYWKYGNVFVYFFNGNIITLPVHKCRIGNITLDGTPIVEYDCLSIITEWKKKSYAIVENWIEDNELETYFKGYPKEIVEAIDKGYQYAQLNPDNVFVLQGNKESWQRYSIPFIGSCLTALAKKELISTYENSILNLATRSFVHVRYGDEKEGMDMLPDEQDLRAVRSIFSEAMSGKPLAVTNHLAKADIVQARIDDLFQWDKYRDVNNDILSAGGISGIIVNGISEDGSTFASAQVSMQTAATRIESARAKFCEMMNQINERLVDELSKKLKYNLKDVPRFSFMPLDMAGEKALRETCLSLWEKGVVSTKTMLETQGYSLEREKAARIEESNDGSDKVLAPREILYSAPEEPTESTTTTDSDAKSNAGRKELDDSERTSDPESAMRGKMPKPSSPDGSMNNTT